MKMESNVKQGLVNLEILNCMLPPLGEKFHPRINALDPQNQEFISFLKGEDLPLTIIKIKQHLSHPRDYLLFEEGSAMHKAIRRYKNTVKLEAKSTDKSSYKSESEDKEHNASVTAIRVLVEECFKDFEMLTGFRLAIHAHDLIAPCQFTTKPLLNLASSKFSSIKEREPTISKDQVLDRSGRLG